MKDLTKLLYVKNMDKKYFEVDPYEWVTNKQLEYEKEWLASGGDEDAVDFFHSGQNLNDEEDKELFNPRKALKFFKLSAELGYAPAMDEYACIISDGDEDVEQDIDTAIALLCKSIDLGYIPSYSSLAGMYEEGQGVDTNIQKAIELYTICAEANDPISQYFLASIYDRQLGKSKDAEYWYSKAIVGSLNSAAHALGNMYYYGRGKDTYMPDSDFFGVDYFRAFSCFTQAYRLGDDTALKNIADCYFNGHGVEMDKDSAIRMYIDASEYDSWASEVMGQIYLFGDGITQNTKKAIEYWKKGAEQGNSECMRELGDFFKWGEIGDNDDNVLEEYIDHEQALYWYQCGAEQGDDYCQSQVDSHDAGEW